MSKAHMDLALLVPSLQRTLRFPLLEADLPVAAVNPQQAAAFRQASGKRNKSDRQDALLLAQLGRVYGDTLLRAKLPERTLRALKALVGYRDDLRRRIHAIERQQESALWMGQEEVLPFLEEELSGVQRLLEEVEGLIREVAAGVPEVPAVQGPKLGHENPQDHLWQKQAYRLPPKKLPSPRGELHPVSQEGQKEKALLPLPPPHPVGPRDTQVPQVQVEHHQVEPPLAVEKGEGQGGEEPRLLQGHQVQDQEEPGLGPPPRPGPVEGFLGLLASQADEGAGGPGVAVE
uniref:Transposase IS110-like N-terminal domain-containing protein n=1 Tax=Thermus caliditerrae TaxID=1330700 RepID=A0A7C5RDL4_9DEIN